MIEITPPTPFAEDPQESDREFPSTSGHEGDAGPSPNETEVQERGEPAPPEAAPELMMEPMVEETGVPRPDGDRVPAVRIPGPGPFEAVGWLVGVVIVHLVASVFMVVMVAMFAVVSSGDRTLAEQPKKMQELVNSSIGVVMGGDQFLFVLAVLVAVGLRLAIPGDPQLGAMARLHNRLGRLRIRLSHLLPLVAAVIPVSLACGQLFQAANRVWRSLLEWMPGLPDVQTVQEVNVLSNLVESMPLPALVVVLAVLPAIGEELVFRGAIGRGLVARCGVIRGVLLSSLLFAMAHVHPAHVISVFPLGVLLHIVYLATRSILAPVLLHFLVNGWAAILAHAFLRADEGTVKLLSGDEAAPWYVLVPAVLSGIAAVGYFWQTRVEFQFENGRWWWPVYRSVECPPGPAAAVRLPVPARLSVLLGIAMVVFYAAFGWEVTRAVAGA